MSLPKFPSLPRGHKTKRRKSSPCKQGCSQPGTPKESPVEMTGLVNLLFALQNATPLTIYGAGTCGEQAGHQCGSQALFPIRYTHPRPHTYFGSKLPQAWWEPTRALSPWGNTVL